MTELVKEYEALVPAYDEAYNTEADDSRPYEHKYRAREMLVAYMGKVKSALTSVGATSTDATAATDATVQAQLQDTLAMCHTRLGVNYVDTEENQAGDESLTKGLVWLAARLRIPLDRLRFRTTAAAASAASAAAAAPAPVELQPAAAAATPAPGLLPLLTLSCTAIEAVNYLSLLHSGWDNHARCLRLLRIGKALYSAASAAVKEHRAAADSAADSGEAAAEQQEEGAAVADAKLQSLCARLDSLYTHCCFYYAQVYGHLSSPAVSVRYVESTLLRQLAEQQHREQQQQEQKDKQAQAQSQAGGSGGGSGLDADHARAVASSVGPDWSGGAAAASLDRLEWSRNVLRLHSYYAVRNRWAEAALCAFAGEVMLGKLVQECIEAKAAPAATPSAAAVTWRDLPDSLSRLLAEVAIHWGSLYEGLLQRARDADAAEKEGTPLSAQQAGDAPFLDDNDEAAADSKDDDDEDGDPFNTGPAIRFGRRGRRRGAPNIVGSDEDAIDLADSDHEGDTALLVPSRKQRSAVDGEEGGTFGSGAGAVLTTGSRGTSLLLALLQSPATAAAKEWITSHGPASIELPGPAASTSSASASPTAAAAVRVPCPATSPLSGLPSLPAPKSIRDFPAARDVFKAALAAYSAALKLFVLDGFVSEHVSVQSSISRCYKYLSHWESDPKRLAAMHTRRYEALMPLIQELSPRVYLRLHKQLSLEAASAAQAAADHKIDLTDSEAGATPTTPAAVKKKLTQLEGINKVIDTAISLFSHFVRCYSDPRLPPLPPAAAVATLAIHGISTPAAARAASLKPLEDATPVEEGSEVALLTAHFSIARLLYKRQGFSVEERVADNKTALARFQYVLAAAPVLVPPQAGEASSTAGGCFDVELRMAREMVSLLPDRIAQMHYRGRM